MEIGLLGPLELHTDAGQPVPVAGARLRALLTLLALDAGRAVSADRLIDGVWHDDPPTAAANALQALISRLRRTGLAVEATATGYRLAIDPDRVDVNRFVRQSATDPAAALELWRGPLDDFPDSAGADRRRLEELHLTTRRRHLAGQTGDVVPELEALVAAHPLDEPSAALLIRALQHQGNPGRALEVFETTRRRLADQLGADPSEELRQLHLGLLRPARGNLPAQVSSFVGRDADLRAVRRLIADHRLVTLLGPGGSGKTRLSVEVGATVTGEVWRVELAPVSDPAEVPQAALTALDLRNQVLVGRTSTTVPPLARLAEALAGRRLLLILDNCEHLIGAAAELADTLLRAAPGLRLLATSREPLGIPGERLHAVEPLALPPAGAAATTASAFPAVRLLLDRAPTTELTDDTVDPVVRVCRALDGMPLAIELAAARLRTLPVALLADRLADRFRLLTGGSRTALPRHQTLRAVVDWSWELLTEPERRLWRRFALFHGGATLAAVEHVCDADVDLLGALVDKSLLVLGADGRYRMLETIREYGLERLAEADESEGQRLRLAGWLTELAGAAEPHLRRADQLTWLRRLADEHDNFHAALRAAIDAGDRHTAAALVARLGWYWWLRAHRVEGAGLAVEVSRMTGEAEREDLALTHTFAALNGMEGALPLDEAQREFRAAEEEGAGPEARHPALRLIGPISRIFGDPSHQTAFGGLERLSADREPWVRAAAKMIVAHLRLNFGQSAVVATAEMREALAGFRAVGDRWGTGFTLSALADMTAAEGDLAQAVRWQREALALVREVGVREDLPQIQAKLAHQLWLAGEPDEGRRVLKQARQAAEEVGLPDTMASVQYTYATFARLDGDFGTARQAIARAEQLMGNPSVAPQFRATVRSAQGMVEAAAGDLGEARRLHAEALATATESRDQPVIALVLVGLADLALREGDAELAAFRLGAADTVRGSRDRSVPDTERITTEARAALGDADFEACYEQASGITLADLERPTQVGDLGSAAASRDRPPRRAKH